MSAAIDAPVASSRRRCVLAGLCVALVGSAMTSFPGCEREGRTAREPAITTASVRDVLLREDTAESARGLVELLARLDQDNVEAIARAFRQNAAATPDWQVVPFLHAWTDLDPVAALEEVQRWKFPFRRRFGAREVAYRWAWQGDPLVAREHVIALEESPVRLAASWASRPCST